ncbi:hypothetical protein KIPB_012652, partial [Kipferlia bialata]|eukprot:g12652.t1
MQVALVLCLLLGVALSYDITCMY